MDRPVIITIRREGFRRNHIHGFPIGQLFFQTIPDVLEHVIFRARGAVAAFPFDPAGLSILLKGLDGPFIDNSIQLFAHAAGLGNGLDFVAIDDAPAVGKGAGGPPPGDGPCGLLPGAVDDLEGTDALVLLLFGMRYKAHAGAVRRQPPVGRKGDQATAIGAADGTGEEVAQNLRIRSFPRENAFVQRFCLGDKGFSNTIKLLYDRFSV